MMQTALDNLRLLARLLRLAMVAFVLIALAGIARGDTTVDAADQSAITTGKIQLRSQAAVESNVIKLADVAQLHGLAARWSDLQVATLADGKDQADVSLAGIKALLNDQGVILARYSLTGFSRCTVRRSTPPTAGNKPVTDDPNVVANVATPIDLNSPMNLAALITDLLVGRLNCPADQVKIDFDESDAEVLNRSVINHRYELTVGKGVLLGPVPVTIHRLEAGKVVERLHVMTHVTRTALALVLDKSVSKGRTIDTQHVSVKPVEIDSQTGPLVDNIDDVIGKIASTHLRPGRVLRTSDLKPPVMVERGELMTVRVTSGALIVRTVLRALEDGSTGDVITARNEATRQTVTVTVTGPRQGVVDLPDQPTATTGQTQDSHIQGANS